VKCNRITFGVEIIVRVTLTKSNGERGVKYSFSTTQNHCYHFLCLIIYWLQWTNRSVHHNSDADVSWCDRATCYSSVTARLLAPCICRYRQLAVRRVSPRLDFAISNYPSVRRSVPPYGSGKQN